VHFRVAGAESSKPGVEDSAPATQKLLLDRAHLSSELRITTWETTNDPFDSVCGPGRLGPDGFGGADTIAKGVQRGLFAYACTTNQSMTDQSQPEHLRRNLR